jgi:fructokinase
MANALGNEGVVASRVGNDDPGREARDVMHRLGLDPGYVQVDDEHNTGTAEVTLDSAGQPQFVIRSPAAWDYLQWVPQWKELAARADVVCFGSLAQRSDVSAATIELFLQSTPPRTLRICDANLREPFYTVDSLRILFEHADLLKVNDQELQRIASLMGVGSTSERQIAQWLVGEYQFRLVCVTRGSRGSLLVSGDQVVEHPGLAVTVADAVGAGDAFTACMAHYYIRGEPLGEISERANRFGAWVATQSGATPIIGGNQLASIVNGTHWEGNAGPGTGQAAVPADISEGPAEGAGLSE